MSEPSPSPETRHQGWRQRRLVELTAADGWPGLVGLFWLEPGANAVGSGDDCPVRLPTGPASLGVIEWSGESVESVRWLPREGDAQTLLSDAKGTPTTVAWGDYRYRDCPRRAPGGAAAGSGLAGQAAISGYRLF